MIKYIIVFFVAVLLSGCDLSKQEVDEKVKQCESLGGSAMYVMSKSAGNEVITDVRCSVKTPDGIPYVVRPSGRGLL